MSEFTITKRIHAPVGKVFALAADIPNASKAIPAILKIEMLTPGPVGKGTKWRETRKMFGKEAVEVMEITDFQPGRSYSVGADSCGARYDSRLEFKADGNGTLVEMRMAYSAPGLFARIMGAMMKGVMRKALDGDLESLKKAAEAG